MPGETHQIIQDIDADGDDSGTATLADLGIDDGGALDLWQTVCEEFGERTLGSEIDPDLLDPTMTVVTAAAAMAAELANGCHHGL